MTYVYDKIELSNIINASGKMTILGVSKVSDNVCAAQKYAGQKFFLMEELEEKIGKFISELIDAKAAHVVSSASAGIALSVAALIGQGDDYHAYHPYDASITKREIILPKGHNVDYGTAVEVMVAQGGGRLVEAGYANMCSPRHLEMMINENTAGILYVKSHHTVQKSMLSIEEALELAKGHKIPLIVDAAAEEDLIKYTKMGIDLLIYSGAKAIEGPSAGLVVGSQEKIDWLRLQGKGIGRSMKIGKDNIFAFAQAIQDYLKFGSESSEMMKERLKPFVEVINTIDGLKAKEVQDDAGRDIYRASVNVISYKTASEVIEELKQGSTKIFTREYKKNNGIIEFDIRSVTKDEMQQIVRRLEEIMETK